MNWLEALLLGVIQGLTEFLPVSSSGHLELGKALLGVEAKESLMFTIVVHGATVLSTIVVFRKDIVSIIKGLFDCKWNEETQYIVKIIISMIPVAIIGLCFKDTVKDIFNNADIILIVGYMLLVTAALLAFTYYSKQKNKNISYIDALIIGIAQAFAVMPGISRSGATIATGLLLGNKKAEAAKFSFLMVLAPILGEIFLDIFSGKIGSETDVSGVALLIGFAAAFFSGLLACKWMIDIVKKGKLIYFAAYCLVIGFTAILI
jgi:undecaprenyl-diphosphatase